jgi:glutamate synthase (NADPH/NADH) small chain
MKRSLPTAERVKLPRQSMPMLSPEVRRQGFQEMNLGLTVLQAHEEAKRCLECSHPRCVQGCPIGVKISEFVQLVCEGDYSAAAAKIREDNVLPAITSRVCPQERQCEGHCILGKRHAPLAIGHLERFVSDYERLQGEFVVPPKAPPTGKRVAIIGSGPAGLSAAADLVVQGHDVTIFEAHDKPGGILLYGIPKFRLPKEIVRYEIDNLRKMGVAFNLNVAIGRSVTIDDLLGRLGFDAVFIATGAGQAKPLGVPGEELAGVYSAHEFLAGVSLLQAGKPPEQNQPACDCRGKTVVVIGGGDTALDAARSAVRLGARRVAIIYRRREQDMPARDADIHLAREEGVELMTLTVPIKFPGDEKGRLRSVLCQRTRKSEPDASGRPSPIAVQGSDFEMPADVAIIALGAAGAKPPLQAGTPDLQSDAHSYIWVNPQSLRTSKPGVFAGGDAVSGERTVVLAMAAGRRAACAIHEYLRGCERENSWRGGSNALS